MSFMIDNILSSSFSSKRKIENECEVYQQNVPLKKRICLDTSLTDLRTPFQPLQANLNSFYTHLLASFALKSTSSNECFNFNSLNSSGYSSSSSSNSFVDSFAHNLDDIDETEYPESDNDDEENIDVGLDCLDNNKENQKQARRTGKKEWKCETCSKIFDRPSLLQRHVRTHTGEKPHACDVCGKAFSTSSSLNTHVRIHSGEKPHECSICGKKFTASSNLYYHKLTHTTDKPHKCSKCSKSFSTPGDLRAHMHTHNGTWPFKCDICSKGFTKQTNLKNHLLTHTGARPFSCLKCDKQFSLACNLKSHMKTHHGSDLENQ